MWVKQVSIWHCYQNSLSKLATVKYSYISNASRKNLDLYLPLLDHGAHLVAGQVHAVKVGEAILALNIFSDELELTEGHLVVLQVSEAHLEHTSLKTVRGDSWMFVTQTV